MIVDLDLGPPPGPVWSLNDERAHHWSWRASRVTLWRDAVFWTAREQRRALDPIRGRRCQVVAHLPVRGNLRRDPANFLGPIKASVDGLVLAGVWPDDTPEWVTVAEPILVVGGLRVVLSLHTTGVE